MDSIKEVVMIVGAAFAAITAIYRAWHGVKAQRVGIQKDQIEVLKGSREVGKDQESYCEFVAAATREKVISCAIGVAVAPKTIAPLMDYYGRGFASLERIRLAWDHSKVEDGALTFRLSRLEKLALLVGMILMLACALSVYISFLQALAVWKVSWELAAEYSFSGLLCGLVAWVFFLSCYSWYVAFQLEDDERKWRQAHGTVREPEGE